MSLALCSNFTTVVSLTYSIYFIGSILKDQSRHDAAQIWKLFIYTELDTSSYKQYWDWKLKLDAISYLKNFWATAKITIEAYCSITLKRLSALKWNDNWHILNIWGLLKALVHSSLPNTCSQFINCTRPRKAKGCSTNTAVY